MRVVKEGQPWPKPQSKVARGLQKFWLGPDGPNAAVVDWHITHFPIEAARRWKAHEGDPTVASWWPLGWSPIGGFAVWRSFIDKEQEQHPTARHAVARLPSHEGYVVAGMLPEGREFGRNTRRLRLPMYTVVGRISRYALRMTPALIIPETSTLLVPDPKLVTPVRRMPAPGNFDDAPIV